jgi:hypothetical protein
LIIFDLVVILGLTQPFEVLSDFHNDKIWHKTCFFLGHFLLSGLYFAEDGAVAVLWEYGDRTEWCEKIYSYAAPLYVRNMLEKYEHLICLFFFCVLIYVPKVPAAICLDPPIWADEFTSNHSRWEWSYNSGTGYKRLGTVGGASVVEIGITDRSTSSSYSDCSLHEKDYRYSYGTFEARLRCTDEEGNGTRGWGTWNYQNPSSVDVAWFWSASSESDPLMRGLQAMVTVDSKPVFQQHISDIDIREWHIYRIEFSSEGTRFYVDGNLVASTPEYPRKKQRSEIWIDNYVIQLMGGVPIPSGYADVEQDQIMYIDWVKFYNDFDSRCAIDAPSSLRIIADIE